jgi:hypothetical protein
MISFRPERALSTYRSLVENFDEAAPILTLIGDDEIVPVMLVLPEDSPELNAPRVIRQSVKQVGMPVRQAVLTVEAEVMHVNKPFAGRGVAVIAYSAGGGEDYIMTAPFRRGSEEVVWLADDAETVIGPVLDRNPIIEALRSVLT